MHLSQLLDKTSKWVLAIDGSSTIVICLRMIGYLADCLVKEARVYYGADLPTVTLKTIFNTNKFRTDSVWAPVLIFHNVFTV